MKFHLDNNIVEVTPEELVKYQELLKEKEENLFRFGHEHQPTEQEVKDNFKGILGSLKVSKVADLYTDSTDISTDEAKTSPTELQVGDRVKVLKNEGGAEGEATVTSVYGHGDVELAGTSKQGLYLEDWINHVSNLEKIEEDKYMGYTFWYIDGSTFNNRIVLKTTLWDYFEDSKGCRYTYKEVHGLTSPINRKIVREEFEEAKHNGGLLRYYSSLDVFAWE